MEFLMKELALLAGMMLTGPAIPADVSDPEIMCLARSIYHEARDQDVQGQFAVAHVMRNRRESPSYPNDYCSVVTEDRGPRKHDCQFSWWCDGKSDKPEDWEAYQLSMLVALEVASGRSKDITGGADHYFAHNIVTPKWSKSSRMVQTVVYEDHTFMRRKRSQG